MIVKVLDILGLFRIQYKGDIKFVLNKLNEIKENYPILQNMQMNISLNINQNIFKMVIIIYYLWIVGQIAILKIIIYL